MRRQAWAFLANLGAAVFAVAALLRGDLAWAAAGGLATAGLWMIARRWNRESPQPFPYVFRWFLRLPRPYHSPKRLTRILQPRSGEHLLEIGPGIGTHSLPVASALAPDGVLDVVDVQGEMLDELMRRASQEKITNIVPTLDDATSLPYAGETFDGAYLIGVLGEIPDRDGALRELWRVLKPHARLVIGEHFIDPDFVSLDSLRARASLAGFAFQGKVGFRFAYFARFQRG